MPFTGTEVEVFVREFVDQKVFQQRDRLKLGIVNLLGVLFQPIMLGEIACLMGWAAWLRRPAGPATPRAVAAAGFAALETFLWTVRLLLPVGAIMTIAIMHVGGYVVAARIPFSVGSFVEGYGGLLNLLLGLPDTVPIWTGPGIAAIALAMMASLARGDRDHRLSLYVFHIVGLPLAMFVAELPNALYPRYYLASGIVFLLLLGRYVELRAVKRPPAAQADEENVPGRVYRHSWVVRGHWRRQWYPSRGEHRPLWIAPHLAGPEDAPLIGGDRVNVLRR